MYRLVIYRLLFLIGLDGRDYFQHTGILFSFTRSALCKDMYKKIFKYKNIWIFSSRNNI